jgi:hypothetical protein
MSEEQKSLKNWKDWKERVTPAIWADTVLCNINDWSYIIMQAERVNKGRFAHDINRDIPCLKDCVEKIKIKDVTLVTADELLKAGKYATGIAYALCVLQNTNKK